MTAWLYVGKMAETTTDYYRTGEIEGDPDPQKKVRIDFQEYADAILHTVEQPTDYYFQLVQCTNINRPAYILYGQKWGEIPERKKQFRSPIFRIQKGGMEPREFAAKKTTLATHFKTNFLTLRTNRLIGRTQQDWITWMAPEDATSVKLMAQPIGNIAISPITIWTEGAVKGGRAYHFRSDAGIFTPYTIPATIYFYEVWLTYTLAGGGETTNKVRYTISDNYMNQAFQFENTYGAIEGICFTGDFNLGASVSKQAYTTQPKFNAKPTDSTRHTYGELVSKIITLSTGALSRDRKSVV